MEASIQATDIPDNLQVQVPGHHNRVNATLAITLAEMLDVSSDDAIKAMASFQGVDRRMSVRFTSEHAIVIEDYAHHPTELIATIKNGKTYEWDPISLYTNGAYVKRNPIDLTGLLVTLRNSVIL